MVFRIQTLARYMTVNPGIFLLIISLFSLPHTLPAQPLSGNLSEDVKRILFVGNSNVGSEGGLHNHFRRTLSAASDPMIFETDWIAMYGVNTLEEMYTDVLVERIRTGNDDLIVLPTGSITAMSQFVEVIKPTGKKLIFFVPWAENPVLAGNSFNQFLEETDEANRAAKAFEKSSGILTAPTALLFYDLIIDPVDYFGLRQDYLFVPGSSVQNDLGTYVNLCTIYSVLTDKSPLGLPIWVPFDSGLVRQIQKRVWERVQDWKNDQVTLQSIPNLLAIDDPVKAELINNKPLWAPVIHTGDSIYYVGNSFIGTEGGLENHLPRLLTEINPPMKILTESNIFWGRGLRSMYTDEVRAKIAESKYDLVVVTSGPTDLLDKFHQDIINTESNMVVHMTWGRNPTINEDGLEGFRRQTESLANEMLAFEQETGVPVVPCGLIYYDLIVDPPVIDGVELRMDWVFMVENIHQNHMGTMINASAHYAVMTGKSPVGLPMWDPYPDGLVKEAQERVWKIVHDWKQGTIIIKPLP